MALVARAKGYKSLRITTGANNALDILFRASSLGVEAHGRTVLRLAFVNPDTRASDVLDVLLSLQRSAPIRFELVAVGAGREEAAGLCRRHSLAGALHEENAAGHGNATRDQLFQPRADHG